MTPSQVSIHLDIDERLLLDDIHTLGHPARMATDNELRKNMIDLMRAGSPSAIADCQARIERMLNEIIV